MKRTLAALCLGLVLCGALSAEDVAIKPVTSSVPRPDDVGKLAEALHDMATGLKGLREPTLHHEAVVRCDSSVLVGVALVCATLFVVVVVRKQR